MSLQEVRRGFRLASALSMADFVRSTDTVSLRPSSLRIVTVLSPQVFTLNGPKYGASSGRMTRSILSQMCEEDRSCFGIND